MALSLSTYKRISDLDSKTTLADDDVLVSDNAAETSSTQITYAALLAQLVTDLLIGTLSSGTYTAGATIGADLTLLDTALATVASSLSELVEDVTQTDTGILQKVIDGTATNVIVPDEEPTEDSVNPVTSAGIYTALSAIQTAIDELIASLAFSDGSLTATTDGGTTSTIMTCDSTVTEDSTNPPTSDAVNTALSAKQDTLTVYQTISDDGYLTNVYVE